MSKTPINKGLFLAYAWTECAPALARCRALARLTHRKGARKGYHSLGGVIIRKDSESPSERKTDRPLG